MQPPMCAQTAPPVYLADASADAIEPVVATASPAINSGAATDSRPAVRKMPIKR
jgi:hypothetical protein